MFNIGQRVKFGGPNWATGCEFDEDDEGREFFATIIGEDVLEKHWIIKPEDIHIPTEHDGFIHLVPEAALNAV